MPGPGSATLVEKFDGGLVTARDPSLLRLGELQRASDCIYHPNDQAIWKAPGRTKYNADGGEIFQEQIGTPATTITVGSWLTDSGGTDLHTAIDEAGVDHNDFIEDDLSVGSGACEVSITGVTDPATSSGHVIEIWAYADTLSAAVDSVQASLVQGVTNKATLDTGELTTTPTRYTYTLSTAETDSITDYNDLRLRFTAGGTTNKIRVTKAIFRVPQVGGNPLAVIKGLRYLQFDDIAGETAEDVLVAYEDSRYHYSIFIAETGTFNHLVSGVGNGPTLDAVHYNNKHYLLNGNGDNVPNQVVKPNTSTGGAPVVRRHGLDPVTEPPPVADAVGAGWLNEDSGFGTGWYFFVTTELVNPDDPDEVESTWEGEAEQFIANSIGVINVDDLADGVTVTRPEPGTGENSFNPSATHWRVYLHGPEDSPDWNPIFLADLWRQGTAPITSGTDTMDIGTDQTLEGPHEPNVVVSSTWDNSTLILEGQSGSATGDAPTEQITVRDFDVNTAAIGANQVLGIVVEAHMQSAMPGVTYLDVQLSWNNGTDFTLAETHRLSNTSGSFQNRTTGDPLDTWGRSWINTEFDDTNFHVRLTYRRTAFLTGSPDIDVGSLFVKIYYGTGAGLTKVDQFQAVCVEIAGITSCIGAEGPPPVSSTGDVFEGQLILNDVQDPSLVRYSLADDVDAFPSIYFLNFETKETDEITAIRRIGDKLVVGLRNQIYRINYLPRAEDSQFDRGRAYEAIAEDHGIVGTQAAALFTPPDRPQLLAYVSHNGLHATDGFQVSTLTEDLDWERMVNVTELDSCILLNYPKYASLVLYYIPAGDAVSTRPTRALWLSYHPSHIKEGGKLLVSGPVKNIAASGHLGRLDNVPILLTGHNDGHVYVEDRAFTDESASGGISPDIVTREIYPAGVGWEFTFERLWVRHYRHVTPTSTVTVDPYWRDTEGEYTHPSAVGNEWTTKTFTTSAGDVLAGSVANLINAGALSRIDMHFIGEAFILQYTEPDGGNGVALSYQAFQVSGHGLEEKR